MPEGYVGTSTRALLILVMKIVSMAVIQDVSDLCRAWVATLIVS